LLRVIGADAVEWQDGGDDVPHTNLPMVPCRLARGAGLLVFLPESLGHRD